MSKVKETWLLAGVVNGEWQLVQFPAATISGHGRYVPF